MENVSASQYSILNLVSAYDVGRPGRSSYDAASAEAHLLMALPSWRTEFTVSVRFKNMCFAVKDMSLMLRRELMYHDFLMDRSSLSAAPLYGADSDMQLVPTGFEEYGALQIAGSMDSRMQARAPPTNISGASICIAPYWVYLPS